jgi:hypothetical protein
MYAEALDNVQKAMAYAAGLNRIRCGEICQD